TRDSGEPALSGWRDFVFGNLQTRGAGGPDLIHFPVGSHGGTRAPGGPSLLGVASASSRFAGADGDARFPSQPVRDLSPEWVDAVFAALAGSSADFANWDWPASL